MQKHALIRRLPAVETLGSVTYICSDKTGTLTRNRMRVEVVFAAGREKKLEAGNAMEGNPWPLLFQAMALNNDASFDREGRAVGDPTETALLEAARDAGWDRDALTEALPRVGELPFDSTRKRMSTLHCEAARGEMDTWVVFVKGAPEETLACCSVQVGRDGVEVLDRAAVLATADVLAARGYRVLGFALRRIEMARERPANDELERDLVFLGFAGLIDPVRPEAASAVDECRSAGITPVMITGDHPATAGAIARELGIVDAGGEVVSGPELAQMDDAALAARVRDIRVYARVDPEQKIRIVRALQARGEFVAMTGDGVNDAPALKRADIGVAMGKGGTDVAREAAAMVLLDDNFATIVSAVREGRRIFDNIRKFLKYSMTGNAGTVWTIFLAPLAGLPIPLLPIQILWINLATDGLPGLALANERAEPNVMQRPPRPPNESMFAHGMGQHIVWVGLAIAAVCVPLQAWAWHAGNSHWQTMIFTVLCFSRLAQCISIRSENHSVFTIGFWSNPLLMGAVLLTVALHLATIYVPVLNPIFKTEPLDVAELTLCFAVSTIVFFTVEIEKWLIRRRLIYARGAPSEVGVKPDAVEVDRSPVAVVAGIPDVLIVEAHPQARQRVPAVVGLEDVLRAVVELSVAKKEPQAAELEVGAMATGQTVHIDGRADSVAVASPQSTVDEHAGGERTIDLGEGVGFGEPVIPANAHVRADAFHDLLLHADAEPVLVLRAAYGRNAGHGAGGEPEGDGLVVVAHVRVITKPQQAEDTVAATPPVRHVQLRNVAVILEDARVQGQTSWIPSAP